MPKTFAKNVHDAEPVLSGNRQGGPGAADLYVYDTDLENRAAFKELLWDAVMHSLVEHHGFKPEDL